MALTDRWTKTKLWRCRRNEEVFEGYSAILLLCVCATMGKQPQSGGIVLN